MTECTTGGWLAEFGCLAVQPQTAVDFGLVALAAGVAVWVLGRQLKHDRAALAAQTDHAQKLAVAAAQRPTVVELGEALIDLGAPLDQADYIAELGRLGAAIYAQRTSEVVSQFDRTWRRREKNVSLPDWFLVWDLWGDIATRWVACHLAARIVVPDPKRGGLKPDDPTLQAMGLAAATILYAAQTRPAKVGAALLAWDGISDLNLRSAIKGWARPLAERGERERRIEHEFLRMMLAYSGDDLPAKVRKNLEARVGPKSEIDLLGPTFDD